MRATVSLAFFLLLALSNCACYSQTKADVEIENAIQKDDASALEEILSSGYDPNRRINSREVTPLIAAAAHGDPHLVEIILRSAHKSTCGRLLSGL
jgi:ankyrin repeat protein